jgi:molybdate transport repressor ModE-like protein
MKPVTISKFAKTTTAELVETLEAVEVHGSMTKAAKELYLAVPTLKSRLHTLEARMGHRVICSGRGLPTALTEYGRELCRQFRQSEPLTYAQARMIDCRAKYPTAVAMLEGGATITQAAQAQQISHASVQKITEYMTASVA